MHLHRTYSSRALAAQLAAPRRIDEAVLKVAVRGTPYVPCVDGVPHVDDSLAWYWDREGGPGPRPGPRTEAPRSSQAGGSGNRNRAFGEGASSKNQLRK